jgi:hypothetical protein
MEHLNKLTAKAQEACKKKVSVCMVAEEGKPVPACRDGGTLEAQDLIAEEGKPAPACRDSETSEAPDLIAEEGKLVPACRDGGTSEAEGVVFVPICWTDNLVKNIADRIQNKGRENPDKKPRTTRTKPSSRWPFGWRTSWRAKRALCAWCCTTVSCKMPTGTMNVGALVTYGPSRILAERRTICCLWRLLVLFPLLGSERRPWSSPCSTSRQGPTTT